MSPTTKDTIVDQVSQLSDQLGGRIENSPAFPISPLDTKPRPLQFFVASEDREEG